MHQENGVERKNNIFNYMSISDNNDILTGAINEAYAVNNRSNRFHDIIQILDKASLAGLVIRDKEGENSADYRLKKSPGLHFKLANESLYIYAPGHPDPQYSYFGDGRASVNKKGAEKYYDLFFKKLAEETDNKNIYNLNKEDNKNFDERLKFIIEKCGKDGLKVDFNTDKKKGENKWKISVKKTSQDHHDEYLFLMEGEAVTSKVYFSKSTTDDLYFFNKKQLYFFNKKDVAEEIKLPDYFKGLQNLINNKLASFTPQSEDVIEGYKENIKFLSKNPVKEVVFGDLDEYGLRKNTFTFPGIKHCFYSDKHGNKSSVKSDDLELFDIVDAVKDLNNFTRSLRDELRVQLTDTANSIGSLIGSLSKIDSKKLRVKLTRDPSDNTIANHIIRINENGENNKYQFILDGVEEHYRDFSINGVKQSPTSIIKELQRLKNNVLDLLEDNLQQGSTSSNSMDQSTDSIADVTKNDQQSAKKRRLDDKGKGEWAKTIVVSDSDSDEDHPIEIHDPSSSAKENTKGAPKSSVEVTKQTSKLKNQGLSNSGASSSL